MKITKKITTAFFILVATACSNQASDAETTKPDEGKAKQELVRQDANTESAVSLDSCAACHGKEGSSSNTDWPNLAGQQSDYLYQQLRAFKDGKRVNPMMSATLLEGYSDEDLRSIADQYSKMTTVSSVDENANDLAGAHVRARCVSCHSMSGNSVTSLWPNLAGQQAGYLANQLRAYKSGERIHPTMQVIANELTEQQIKDVAEYYSKVNP